MDGRTDIMMEAGQGQLGRSHTAANRLFGFKEEDGTAGFSQGYTCCQPIWPRADNYSIILSQSLSFLTAE
jgi:hypothetical protein